MKIFEDSRNQLVARSKIAQKEKDGRTRYQKRTKSKISSSVKQYNQLDMNALFKDNILNIKIQVQGETDNYFVKISFGGFLDVLQDQLSRNNTLDLRTIIRSLIIAFNKDNVYINCSCPDFKYRFGFYATINKINSGEPELIPSDETNPEDKLGPGCKHIMLVLSNATWLIKVASVINNYIHYMEKYRQQQYADIIYPAIYGKEYEEPVQLNIEDDTLETDKDTIDKSNEEGKVRGRFSSTNQPIRNPSLRKVRGLDNETEEGEE